jgi:S-ribosylhomocysteine lyase LuxS involved in autoinducer biosynthesis
MNCVSLKSCVEILTSSTENVTKFVDIAFKQVIKLKWATVFAAKERDCGRNQSCQLDLGLQASRTVRNKFLGLTHPVCGIFVIAGIAK